MQRKCGVPYMSERVIVIKEIRNPLVSVIIPTYNEERYIERCLKAIRAQEVDFEFEVIVSDSNSKDKTVEIAKRYADKIIITDEKGIAKGRNLGAKIAKGKYLLFVDADTQLYFNCIKELVNSIKKKGVIGATCMVIPENPTISNYLLYLTYNIFSKISVKSPKPQVAGIVCMYKKKYFYKVGGFREDLAFSEDFDLSERISLYGKIVFTEKTFAITSIRRLKKFGKLKGSLRYLWLYLGYLLFKDEFAKNEKLYPPIR